MAWSREFQDVLKADTWESQEQYNRYVQDVGEKVEQLKWACYTLGGIGRPDHTEKGKHYVYVVLNDRDDPVYIGKGTGQRYRHATSGASHSKALNKLYYAGKQLHTVVFEDELVDSAACRLEQDMIAFYNPLCNVFGLSDTSYNRGSGKRGLSPYEMLTEGMLARDWDASRYDSDTYSTTCR